jgi:Zn-dependent hydrolases, including glyoxylases
MADFPLPLEEGVFYCGFNSPKSYGGKSYFVQHPQGNWLIDSPKFLPQLVARLEEQGGISHIFLTHRDDVAEAEAYAQRFGAARIIHREDSAAQPNAEIVLKGVEPVQLAPEFLVIPTPGHTQGHCVLLHKSRFLFTGDHLWWNPSEQRLGASRDYCWYSWAKQTESMIRLLEFDFEWVLPGHGQWVHQPASSLRKQLKALVDRMRANSDS